MSTIRDRSDVPFHFSIEPHKVRGLESPTGLSLQVDRRGAAGFAITFDKAAQLQPNEVDRLRQYLMDTPRAELDQIFGKAIDTGLDAVKAHQKAEPSAGDELVFEGCYRVAGKLGLLAFGAGPLGWFGFAIGLGIVAYYGAQEERAAGQSRVAAFAKGALDLSFIQQVFERVLGRNSKRDAALAEEAAAHAELSSALVEVKAHLLEIAKGV